MYIKDKKIAPIFQIIRDLNITQSKTLNRIIKDLKAQGYVEEINYSKFESEGIIDLDKRHKYIKFLENGNPENIVKKKIWNKIIKQINEIIKHYDEKVKITDNNDKMKIKFLLNEFLGDPATNIGPSWNYDQVADVFDCQYLFSLLTKLDDDQESDFQMRLISFILGVIKIRKIRDYPKQLIKMVEDYYDVIFEEWINSNRKWGEDLPYTNVIKNLLWIISLIAPERSYVKFSEFLLEDNINELRNNENSDDPFKNFKDFLRNVFVGEGNILKEELKKREDAFFENQTNNLYKNNMELYKLYGDLRLLITY
ncbi:MAG: hypothetical protein ACP5SF_05165 [Thermoplasmata archaeon]